VRKYKGKQNDIQSIADELKVRAVLVGRLLQQVDFLSISVELIDAQDNRQLWGTQYNQEFTEIFNIQQNVAYEISSKLHLKLTSVQKTNIEKTYTNNSKAYEEYLKGIYHYQKFSVEGFLKSIEYFQQSLQIDPNYALAYVGLALAYTHLGSYHGEMRPRDAIQKAREALWKALELDDRISEIYTSLGFINLFYDWDWQEAERAFLRAIKLNPNSVLAHQHYGIFLAIMGRTKEAIVEQKLAHELDPLTTKVYDDLAWSYLDLGQFNEAINLWNSALELDPNFFSARRGLGTAYILRHQFEKGIEEFKMAVNLSNRHHRYLGYLGWALALKGQEEKALEIIKELKGKSNHAEVHAIDIAHVYIGLGDKEKAFYWLNMSYQSGSSEMVLIRVDPYYDNLRSEPQFKEMLKKMRFEY
jgi:tetratricopeptide (TPR) repeat protein